MSVVSIESSPATAATSRRSEALAMRLEQGARALSEFARTLTDAEWRTPFSTSDKRKIGVIVHHVASIYPLEIQLAQVLATGQPITDVTRDAVAHVTAHHAKEKDGRTTVAGPDRPVENAGGRKKAPLELLARNSAAAAAASRALSDVELAQAAPVSLYGDA